MKDELWCSLCSRNRASESQVRNFQEDQSYLVAFVSISSFHEIEPLSRSPILRNVKNNDKDGDMPGRRFKALEDEDDGSF